MHGDKIQRDPSIWRPQARFSATMSSRRQLRNFNDTGGIAVFMDLARSVRPDIEITGSQSVSLGLWETRSRSGFVTKPKFSAGLLTIRFVTSGHVVYSVRSGKVVASPTVAALTGFDDLYEMQASSEVGALGATIAIESLAAAHTALTGDPLSGLPAFEPVADMAMPGMKALLSTIRLVQRRLQERAEQIDLMLPMLQEIIAYQLISAWPKRVEAAEPRPADLPSRHLRLAIDYIEANLATALTLSDIAAAVGTSVRSLQSKFKKELARTPVQFIIERRLSRVHDDLLSATKAVWSIAEIARHHGFVHMSDFSQRYRRLYGHTPSETRRHAARAGRGA